jgi:V/A-type H+-transporting ATPase subunit I
MTVPMVHFRAQVPNKDAAAATRAIAREGLLHLVDIAHGRMTEACPEGVRDLYASFRDIVHRVSFVIDRLGVGRRELSSIEETDFVAERERILLVLEPIEKRVQDLFRRLGEARQRVDAERDAERLRHASIDLNRLRALRFATIRLGIAPDEALPAIAELLEPSTSAIVPLGDELFAAIVPASARTHLDEAMRLSVAQPIDLRSVDVPVRAADALQAVENEIAAEREMSASILQDLAERAEVAMLLLQAETHFAASGRFVVIAGWVPRDSAERLKQRVMLATHDRAIVDIDAAEKVAGFAEGTLRVPILHRNPMLLRPFQKLIDIYGTPSYAEVEPTAFFAIGFLAMFGLMFGDVGHGAILFFAGWLLFRQVPRFLDYGILLMEAGTSSALFGVLYGSVFGIRGLIPTLWLEPIDDLPRFMFVAVGFGVVVVTGGLLLNVINTWRSGDVKAAIFGSRGVAGALLYWVVLVILARAFVPATAHLPAIVIVAMIVGAIAILAAASLIVRSRALRENRRPHPPVHSTPLWLRALEGSVELVDTLFSFFANTISFVRIAAFAAVHAGVFIAIFSVADTISAVRFGGVLSILVHVAGNAVVILLEGLTVSVQVLRLEYYEFFGKFFRGGGEPYAPLQIVRKEHHA